MKSSMHHHLLGIEGLSKGQINTFLDLADEYVEASKRNKITTKARNSTLINLFFEDSTRTRTSFELAGKRLQANVINMSPETSSIRKGETLIDTAMTLNAMHPSLIIIRHGMSGAPHLIADKVNCSVVNAGDGRHEHPTQALLDALTIRRRKGKIEGLKVAICGDLSHSRVARSNIHLLVTMGADVRVIGPPTLVPDGINKLGVKIYHNMYEGLDNVDIVMILRLQLERMNGDYVPSTREYFRFWGLDRQKLSCAKRDALVMHPGPINRGIEIDSDVADDISRSLILEQVELGVAVRMAVIEHLVLSIKS